MIVYYSRNLILQRVKVLWDHVVMPSKDFWGRNSLHCDIFTLYHWGLPCQRSSLRTNKRKFVSNLLNYQDWLTNREALTVLCSVGKHTGSRKTLGTNTGMRIMQELIFNWVCCGRTLCEPIVFIFGTEKEHDFKKNENIVLLHLKERKKRLIYLNSHRFFVVYCLYCLNTSK